MMLNLNEKPNLHEAALDLWYMSKEEIIENSPSKRDGISWKTEMYLRKSYCTFLRKLGKRLKMRQVYIATAIVLCHRFFLRQSLAKNDRWTIATVCLFLAGKIEDDPRPIREIILASYELIHENDLFAVQKIKRKEVYDQQKKQIILAEKIVLINLDFSIDVRLPYKPLIEALRKLGLSGHRLAQVAWNFVNDGLKTLLCLQFQPQQIAAGAIFLAAKFLNVNIPSDGAKTWWQDFDVSQIQLDEICNQTMRLYEKKQIPTENLEVQATETGKQNIDLIAEVDSYIIDPYMDHELGDIQNSEQLPREDNEQEKTDGSNAAGTEGVSPGEQDRIGRTNEVAENKSSDDSAANKSSCDVKQNLDLNEGLNSYSPSEVIKMISENELMAVLERMRKEQEEVALKIKEMDEDDLFIKELEAKLAIENVKHDSLDNDDETGDVKHAIAIADKAEEPQKVTDDALLAPNSRKRKAVRPPAGQPAAKRRLGSGDHNGFGE